MNLTEEEKYYLEDFFSTDYWPVIQKVLQMGMKRAEEDLLTTEITTSDRPIAFARARLDGARALTVYVSNLARKTKKKEK